MKRKIVTNLKELRIPSETITSFSETQDIIKDLEDSLDLSKGIGLSAIQIGIPKRVGIIRLDNIKIDLVNAVILEKFDKFKMKGEACLSLPNIRIDTLRYREITLENDGKIQVFDIQIDGILPIAIQHEIDHCFGRLIIDKKWRKRK